MIACEERQSKRYHCTHQDMRKEKHNITSDTDGFCVNSDENVPGLCQTLWESCRLR